MSLKIPLCGIGKMDFPGGESKHGDGLPGLPAPVCHPANPQAPATS